MRRKFSIRDFAAGAIVGVMLGTSGLAAAALGYEGWQKLSQDFKIGYVAGYLDMSNIARNLDPGGYIDTKYPKAHAKPLAWAAMVDELYRDPAYQRYTINSMMQAVAVKLEQKYGKTDPVERSRNRMAFQMEALRRQKEARAKKAGTPVPEVKHEKAPDRSVVATPKKPPTRKWCRCDGKDPKAERAKRRAAREAAAKAATGGAKATAPGAVTPPGGEKAAPPPEPAKQPPTPAKP
jgi:hypothetical protein